MKKSIKTEVGDASATAQGFIEAWRRAEGGERVRRMNRPAPKLSANFKGDKMITPDTALRLVRVVGVPAHIWIGVEFEYRLAISAFYNIQPATNHKRCEATNRPSIRL